LDYIYTTIRSGGVEDNVAKVYTKATTGCITIGVSLGSNPTKISRRAQVSTGPKYVDLPLPSYIKCIFSGNFKFFHQTVKSFVCVLFVLLSWRVRTKKFAHTDPSWMSRLLNGSRSGTNSLDNCSILGSSSGKESETVRRQPLLPKR
jgi:hypothetical protein